MTEITHKNCSKCGLYLQREKFYQDKKRPDGLRSRCKKCDRRISRITKEVAKWDT